MNTKQASALVSLPQPLHLFAYVTWSQHYHHGWFETPEDSLRDALDRLALRGAEHLTVRSRILDVGCGLGGTTHLLGTRGHEVVGIDPCERAIAFARTVRTTGSARFLACDLNEFARNAAARFDHLVLIEVLQHFRSLEALFSCCAGLLRPGGTMVVHDVAKLAPIPFERVPYHQRGALRAVAARAGWGVLEEVDATEATSPTLGRIASELENRRAEIREVFGGVRPVVEREVDELAEHVEHLGRGFANGDLVFESFRLQSASHRRLRTIVPRACAELGAGEVPR